LSIHISSYGTSHVQPSGKKDNRCGHRGHPLPMQRAGDTDGWVLGAPEGIGSRRGSRLKHLERASSRCRKLQRCHAHIPPSRYPLSVGKLWSRISLRSEPPATHERAMCFCLCRKSSIDRAKLHLSYLSHCFFSDPQKVLRSHNSLESRKCKISRQIFWPDITPE